MTEPFAAPTIDQESNGHASDVIVQAEAERAERIDQDMLVRWARELATLAYDVTTKNSGEVHDEVDALRYGVDLRRLEECLLGAFGWTIRDVLTSLIDGQDSDTQSHILSRSTLGVQATNLVQVVKDARPKPEPKPVAEVTSPKPGKPSGSKGGK